LLEDNQSTGLGDRDPSTGSDRGGGVYTRFVAVGDSFTEGLDDLRADGTYRGWADLVAAALADRNPGLRYANLAVRGRRLARIRDEQVPPALAMRPDLVAVAAGGNDIIGFRVDVPSLTRSFHEMLAELTATGARVVVFAGFDPRGRLPMSRVLAARAAAYNAAIVGSARQLGADVVDLWHLVELYQDDMWAPDRLHLSSRGHLLVADAVLGVLGIEGVHVTATSDAVTEAARRRWLAARREDAAWARAHLAPWVVRKVRGRSTGDFLEPKRPDLEALTNLPPRRIDLRDWDRSDARDRS
jgi:lysophospholipase L1-like esterase